MRIPSDLTRYRFGAALLALLIISAVSIALAQDEGGDVPGGAELPGDFGATTGVEQLVPEIISVRPHDPNAWTQGLLYHDGFLYESTGNPDPDRSPISTLRQVDPQTGAIIRRFDWPEPQVTYGLFAEGLALLDNRLYQLTWLDNFAIAFDLTPPPGNPETFQPVRQLGYAGQGWGLCNFDDTAFYMSNGSSLITVREPNDFVPIRVFEVTLDDVPVQRLNELECVDGAIYANVWQTTQIMRIDPTSGGVTAVIEAANLRAADEIVNAEASVDVLNGIAYDSDADTFLLTGKYWPALFEVRFILAEN
ncbi:MAG: glutaminyl-peptide cyclotransferase [Chloroflexi bacterium]|nr:glutaminyl-peptide cyclotransferase [Chloroflexota bacterium]